MSEPLDPDDIKLNCNPDHSDNDDEEFLDAKDFPDPHEKSERHHLNSKVLPNEFCSDNNLIDIQHLSIECKEKRKGEKEKVFLIDDPYNLVPNGRKELPSKVPPRQFSIWSLLRDFVGRDLTRISMPIFINEPLSLLQKFVECFEYTNSIRKMIEATDPVERLEYAAANYAIFQSSHAYRVFKPFNPLLGETYELRNDEKKFVYIAEQVCHHPPITSFFLQLPNFRAYATYQVGIKFFGNSCDTILDGVFYFEFLDSKGEVENLITFSSPLNTARNIIIGKYLQLFHWSITWVHRVQNFVLRLIGAVHSQKSLKTVALIRFPKRLTLDYRKLAISQIPPSIFNGKEAIKLRHCGTFR